MQFLDGALTLGYNGIIEIIFMWKYPTRFTESNENFIGG